MRLRIGNPRSVLVIAPHPDDETIGAWALMALLRRAGVLVRVMVVTDGAASHPNSPGWPRARLVLERRRETRRAMRRIGVAAGDITFLGLADGAPSFTSACRGIGRALACAPAPALVVAPAASDDHPDHRVTAAAVARTRRPGARHLAYPVWPAGTRLRGARTLPLTVQLRLAKRHAVCSYGTQAGRITDDPGGFQMTRAQIAAFTRPCETYVERRR